MDIYLSLLKESDFGWVILCLMVLLSIAFFARKKYANTEIQRYFLPALILRFVFSFLYTLVIHFIYGAGDTTMYYRAVSDLRQAVIDDPEMWKHIYLNLKLDASNPLYVYFMYDNGYFTHFYMQNITNYMIPRFALPFSMLFGNSYLCINFCMSFFSFIGCWRIYKLFVSLYPQLHKKFAYAILFLPSILFSGGSLMKDSVCLGAMGISLYAAYNIFFSKRKILISVFLLVVNGVLMFYIKPYILLCLMPAFLTWRFIKFRHKMDDVFLRRSLSFIFILVCAVAIYFSLDLLTKSEMAEQYSTDNILQTIQSVQGGFNAADGGMTSNYTLAEGEVFKSTAGLLLLFPLGVTATFFRPFLWEATNPLMLLTALEALGFLVLTLMAFFRIGLRRFFQIAFQDPNIVFCMVFSILFAGIVGITTTNFGALVRYKMPALPFFLFMLFIIMDKSGKFSQKHVFGKKFF